MPSDTHGRPSALCPGHPRRTMVGLLPCGGRSSCPRPEVGSVPAEKFRGETKYGRLLLSDPVPTRVQRESGPPSLSPHESRLGGVSEEEIESFEGLTTTVRVHWVSLPRTLRSGFGREAVEGARPPTPKVYSFTRGRKLTDRGTREPVRVLFDTWASCFFYTSRLTKRPDSGRIR